MRLSELTHDDLAKVQVWAVEAASAEDEDVTLLPVILTESGLVPSDVGEVWCLCVARFADGSEHKSCAMCRGDSSDGPLLWTAWTGTEEVPLFVPPAPSFALSKGGPVPFAAKFARSLEQVFPLTVEAITGFTVVPRRRRVTIGADGVLE
jgi:hypothetical protein